MIECLLIKPFRLDCDTINSKEDESRNTFVELALNYSFAMLARLVPAETLTKTLESGLEIVIAGNNDFYSQRNEVTNTTWRSGVLSLCQHKIMD